MTLERLIYVKSPLRVGEVKSKESEVRPKSGEQFFTNCSIEKLRP